MLKNLGNDSSKKGNYYNNYNIKVQNILYALHRYESSKKTGVGDAWNYATKYKKKKFTSGAITDINEIKKYQDIANIDMDTDTYDYTIRKELATGASEKTDGTSALHQIE